MLEQIITIVGALSGIAALGISLWGVNRYEKKRNQFIAVHKYLSDMASVEMLNAKRNIYKMKKHRWAIPISNSSASLVVGQLHHWGLLAKKGYLPMWVFDEGSASGVIRLFNILQPYIFLRRIKYNEPTYGSGFEWLYNTLTPKKPNVKRQCSMHFLTETHNVRND